MADRYSGANNKADARIYVLVQALWPLGARAWQPTWSPES